MSSERDGARGGHQIMAPLICEYIGPSSSTWVQTWVRTIVMRRKDKYSQQVTRYAASVDLIGAATFFSFGVTSIVAPPATAGAAVAWSSSRVCWRACGIPRRRALSD